MCDLPTLFKSLIGHGRKWRPDDIHPGFSPFQFEFLCELVKERERESCYSCVSRRKKKFCGFYEVDSAKRSLKEARLNEKQQQATGKFIHAVTEEESLPAFVLGKHAFEINTFRELFWFFKSFLLFQHNKTICCRYTNSTLWKLSN